MSIPAIVAASMLPAVSAAKAIETAIDEKRSKPPRASRRGKKVKKVGPPNKGRASKGAGRRTGQSSKAGFGSSTVSAADLKAFASIEKQMMPPISDTSSVGPATQQSLRVPNTLSFDWAHLAQRNVEKSFRNGVRLVATNVDGSTAISSAGSLRIRPGNSGQTSQAWASSGTASSFNLGLLPSVIDDKLQLFEQVFEFMACRYLLLRLRGAISEYNTLGANTSKDPNLNVVVGILKDADEATQVITFKAIGDLEDHVETRVTARSVPLRYAFTGSELFRTKSTYSSDPDLFVQARLVAAFDNVSAADLGVDATHPGSVHMHTDVLAVYDFYGLSTVDTSDNFPKLRKAISMFKDMTLQSISSGLTVPEIDTLIRVGSGLAKLISPDCVQTTSDEKSEELPRALPPPRSLSQESLVLIPRSGINLDYVAARKPMNLITSLGSSTSSAATPVVSVKLGSKPSS